MANKKIYIQNGSAVNAAWTGLIAMSPDGVTWSTFPKLGLQVNQHTFTLDKSGYNNVNKFGEPGQYIVLQEHSDKEVYCRFLFSNVVNQTWTSANDAVEDINTWIGEIYP